MSIYCTLWNIQIEDNDRGGAFSDAWIEVWAQGVPNHINEQNGYGGPGWDEWLPAFEHQPDCQMRTTSITSSTTGKAYPWYDCECGLRAVFICDDLTKKATERNGQEYVNPVLVLSGREYDAIPFDELLQRIEEAVSERRGKPPCLEPECVQPAVHTEIRRGQIVKAWCDEHDIPKRWRGQTRRRAAATKGGEQ